MDGAKILVADDNPHIVNLVRDSLEARGFRVVAAADGTEALRVFRREAPNLVLLDVAMPGMDGLQVCRLIRQESGVPILFLTANNQLEFKLEGFDLGANDYITKPFHVLELVARIKAALHHGGEPAQRGRTVTIGDLRVDIAGNQAYRGERRLDLSRTEFDLLKVLVENVGRTLTRQFLLETVWGYDESVVSRTLDSFIRNLRNKVELDPRHPQVIKTVHGIGYRLERAARAEGIATS